MIRSFSVQLNAAHPELPLMEATAIVGSPSTANIYNVPKQIGTWDILKVFIQVSYPNGSTVTEEAVKTAQGIWTATVPMCEMSGRVKSGFTVIADGEDENGDEITGYILGVADFAVYTRGLVVRDGEKVYNLRYFDIPPAVPSKGDVAPFNGILKLYDGYNWISFADDVDLSDYYTKEETDALFDDYYTKDETDAAIDALAAYYITSNAAGANFPTRAALLSATTYYSGGVVRTPTRNDYAVVLADEMHGGAEYRYIYGVAEGSTTGQWEAQYPIETNDYTGLSNKPSINGVELSGNKTGEAVGLVDIAGATMTGGLTVPHVDLTENVVNEPVIRTRIANGAILISWDRGQTYYKFKLPYMTGDCNMITAEAVNSIFGKIAPTWESTTTYAVDDIVYWVGAYYRCTSGGTTGNPAYDISHWTREDLIASIQRAMGAYVPLVGTSDITGSLRVSNSVRAPNIQLSELADASYSFNFSGTIPRIRSANNLWTFAWTRDLPYEAESETITTAQTETVGGETIRYAALTPNNRTAMTVAVLTDIDELRITMPRTPAQGESLLRDFYLRVEVGDGTTAMTAPAIVPLARSGQTITIEADGGTMPTLADGTADGKGVTLLYLTETKLNTYLVKAATITEVA